jgi:prevent-host-death family protein
MTPPQPHHATAGELGRNFGQWQDKAQTAPVIITHHGRPRVVLLSAEQYTLLQAGVSAPETPATPDRSEAEMAALLNHLPHGFLSFDQRLRIRSVNVAFEDMANRAAARLLGGLWEERFPAAAAVIQEHLKRTLRTGETAEFEAIGAVRSELRYTIRTFSYASGVAMIIQNSTREWETAVRLEETAALRAALAALGHVASIRLNIRAAYVGVDGVFTASTGFELREIEGARFIDTIRPVDRRMVTDALEVALQRSESLTFATTFLAKGAKDRPVRVSAAPILQNGIVQGLTLLLAFCDGAGPVDGALGRAAAAADVSELA